MGVFIVFIKEIVLVFLWALQAAMLLRSLLSLVLMDSKIYDFLATVTEPFIMPVRMLLAKFNLLQNTPIDFSSLITYIIVSMLLFFLP